MKNLAWGRYGCFLEPRNLTSKKFSLNFTGLTPLKNRQNYTKILLFKLQGVMRHTNHNVLVGKISVDVKNNVQ